MTRFRTMFRAGLLTLLAFLIPLAATSSAQAAPFAAYVMDGRTGKQIHAQNADTRLHPASLTKMMTLYMAFTAIERGQVRLDTKFTISSKAAGEPPSRLGLRAGQTIELRYLIRAAAIKSANDAATAIGENLAGSEQQFAAQMTAMARALGMNNTQFRNAHGLTASGHYSTARDMTLLGRRLFYDFPQYYSIFSRRSADAGVATVRSTNRTFLDNYAGADGIKTGYTRAAGFNLTASAQRGSKRIIATVMGGTSTAHRNATMGQLLDMGFGRAPTRVQEVRPAPPQYIVEHKSSRRVTATASTAPVARPANVSANAAVASKSLNEAMNVAMAQTAARPAAQPAPAQAAPASSLRLTRSARPRARPGGRATDEAVRSALAAEAEAPAPAVAVPAGALSRSARPPARPGRTSDVATASTAGTASVSIGQLDASASLALVSSPTPQRRSDMVIVSAGGAAAPEARPTERVSRASSSGGQNWGVSLGRFPTREQADARLVQVAQQENALLQNALRHIRESSHGYEATLVGLSRSGAARTCERLAAQSLRCDVTAP